MKGISNRQKKVVTTRRANRKDVQKFNQHKKQVQRKKS